MRFDWSLVRVVPDSFVGEFINVGVIVGDPMGSDWVCRYVEDETHALQLAQPHHLMAVREFLRRVSVEIAAGEMSRARLDLMHHDQRNLVQLSPPHPMVAESASEAADLLMSHLVVQVARAGEREAS